jgi:hypothetical protein
MSEEENLSKALEREIALMREILANMHQEELALLLHDKEEWNAVVLARSPLVERLENLRRARIDATLPQIDLEDPHIQMLRDQLVALIEKMNAQHVKNEILFCRGSCPLSLPDSLGSKPMRRRRTALATLPPKQ